MFIITS